jgi:hypothetical protein
MRRTSILLLSIIIVVLLLSSMNFTHYPENYRSDLTTNSPYYLNHNITIKKNSNLSFSNENLVIFQQNVSIFDCGELNITNTHLDSINFSINIFVLNGRLNFRDVSINSSGNLKALNSTLNFNNVTIQNNANITFNFIHDKLLFIHSNIRFYSNPNKYNTFTSAKLFGSSLPYDAPGTIQLKESDIYNNSFLGNLSIHLYIRGDNNGTGELELYEFGNFIENVSIPVRQGYHNYTINVTLPTDIKSSELNNTNKLAFKLPKIEKYNQSQVAGEDGNLTFYNITILAISNDTENYYGLDNYNMMIYNSSVISYYSDFRTNFRKFYIYQHLFNPNKKSIFLINSTFYSYASKYNGSIYRNPPFYGINSSVYYYEMPKFVFSNSIYSIPLKYSIIANNYNESYNLKANNINKNITKLHNSIGNPIIFDMQSNNTLSYYGNYKLLAGRFEYNFSLPPLPSFSQKDIITIPVNIPNIKSSLIIPKTFTSGLNNNITLDVESGQYSSTISVEIEYAGHILYNNTRLKIDNNASVVIPLHINSNHSRLLHYTITYNNKYYNYTKVLSGFSFLKSTPTPIQKYMLVIKSPVTDWEIKLGNKEISEVNQVASFSLPAGNYSLAIYKNGYVEKTYNVNLKGNMTMYISLQKVIYSDKKIGTMYLITGIIIAGTVFGMFVYSKRTITCKNCGTRHYATFDKCPVCLNPVKHRIVRKKQ